MPGGISLEVMFSRTSLGQIAADTTRPCFSCHSNIHVSNALPLLDFPSHHGGRKYFFLTHTKRQIIKTPSCTTCYCFKTVISACRQKEGARQSVRHSLPALILQCRSLHSRSVQNKPALCHSLSVV